LPVGHRAQHFRGLDRRAAAAPARPPKEGTGPGPTRRIADLVDGSGVGAIRRLPPTPCTSTRRRKGTVANVVGDDTSAGLARGRASTHAGGTAMDALAVASRPDRRQAGLRRMAALALIESFAITGWSVVTGSAPKHPCHRRRSGGGRDRGGSRRRRRESAGVCDRAR
jgi:hypothetical protein